MPDLQKKVHKLDYQPSMWAIRFLNIQKCQKWELSNRIAIIDTHCVKSPIFVQNNSTQPNKCFFMGFNAKNPHFNYFFSLEEKLVSYIYSFLIARKLFLEFTLHVDFHVLDSSQHAVYYKRVRNESVQWSFFINLFSSFQNDTVSSPSLK